MKLRDWSPIQHASEVPDKVAALFDHDVVKVYSSASMSELAFRQAIELGTSFTHKNIHTFVVLESKWCVAFNENPGRGWSFPVCKYKL